MNGRKFDTEDAFGRRLFVGGLSLDEDVNALAQILRETYGVYGKIEDVHIPTDWESGRPRGFAFVTMADPQAAILAISSTDGTEMDGRKINVSMARPRNYVAARRSD